MVSRPPVGLYRRQGKRLSKIVLIGDSRSGYLPVTPLLLPNHASSRLPDHDRVTYDKTLDVRSKTIEITNKTIEVRKKEIEVRKDMLNEN
jgi:hypothetical protein